MIEIKQEFKFTSKCIMVYVLYNNLQHGAFSGNNVTIKATFPAHQVIYLVVVSSKQLSKGK